MQVAKTILEQLGGSRFLAMTGAKNLIGLENGLQFKLPRFTGVKINSVRITLDDSDTYTVEFGNVSSSGYSVLKSIQGVYWDMLRDIFTSETGLETSL